MKGSSSIHMLTFEENASSTFGGGSTYKSYALSDYMSGLTTTKEYGFSIWIKKNSWTTNYQTFLRLSNNAA